MTDDRKPVQRGPSAAEAPGLTDLVDAIAQYYATSGVPPIAGRVIGWLLVCDPPAQAAAEIATAVGASLSSVSTNLKLLTGYGLVRKVSLRGQREALYRIDGDLWVDALQAEFTRLGRFRVLACRGLALIGPDGPRADRLRSIDGFYGWLEDEMRPVFDRWRRDRGA
jgi:DNA-binding transcriptional ArsR family regulator